MSKDEAGIRCPQCGFELSRGHSRCPSCGASAHSGHAASKSSSTASGRAQNGLTTSEPSESRGSTTLSQSEQTVDANNTSCSPSASPLFNRDRFYFSRSSWRFTNERFSILDESERLVGSVVRHWYIGRFLQLILLSGFGMSTAVLVGIIGGAKQSVFGITLFLLLLSGTIACCLRYYKPRIFRICGDEGGDDPLLTIRQQDRRSLFFPRYVVTGEGGSVVGTIERDSRNPFSLRRWKIREGAHALHVERCGPHKPGVGQSASPRTRSFTQRFQITRENGLHVGGFTWRFTPARSYLLDLQDDRLHGIDRRLALAFGVLLQDGG